MLKIGDFFISTYLNYGGAAELEKQTRRKLDKIYYRGKNWGLDFS